MPTFSRPLAQMLFSLSVLGSAALMADPSDYVEFDDPALKQGREIWIGSCEGCHGYGIAGAPIPMEPDEWQERLKKETSVLYDHAINGFFGPDDTMMPERGGNPELSDEQVKAAVDYMTTLARHYIDKQ